MNKESIFDKIGNWFDYSEGPRLVQCVIPVVIGFIILMSFVAPVAIVEKVDIVFEGQKGFDSQSKVYTMVDIVSDKVVLDGSAIRFAYYDSEGKLSKADTDAMYKPFIKNGARFNFINEKRDRLWEICRTIIISSLVLFAVLFIIGQTALVIHRKRAR